DSGQRWWQMLPITPPGGGNSPYDSPSTFAASPLLVSLEHLQRDGLLESGDLAVTPQLAQATRALYPSARRLRERCLRKAFAAFQRRNSSDEQKELEAFAADADWVEDYALFCALKKASKQQVWTQWDPLLVRRDARALASAKKTHAAEIGFRRFVQYRFARDWRELREHAARRGVRFLGDLPMFVAHDGADVWSHQKGFQLHPNGEKRVVAGVPPDYFSAEGQLWGNPLYDWTAMSADGYSWWIRRLKQMLQRFDAVRLDHFIGFYRYWEVAAGAQTAREGRFVLVPGAEVFDKARKELGSLPFIAEDLGLVTAEVTALRERFEMPGMRVLMFAFSGDWREYQPHRFDRRTAVYTGTHDNDTTLGWLTAHERTQDGHAAHHLRLERERALRYAGSDGKEPHWDMIRMAMASVANVALFPLQDVLGLNTESRMNVPGTASGNWTWRYRREQLLPQMGERLRTLAETYERIPPGLGRHG
ncbi:MAG TPA: 4-alpha-glucanotransferase, partial [Polyangiaceae bacterium]|nr:4-alpha-glucanotransferase [Polyangiaceae bacterium]